MARKKATEAVVDAASELDKEYAKLAKETGGDTLDQLDSVKYYIDTGNLAINFSCSGRFITGGLPGGRIIEAYGPEASGKSLIGSNSLYGCQAMGGWVILLDCENASNGEFMSKVSHLNLKNVVRYAPSSLERAFRQIHVSVKAIRDRDKALNRPRKPIFVMFDSLTVPPCERELRENGLSMDFSITEWKKIVGAKEQPGERARVISGAMRKLQSMTKDNDVTVYVINQVRDKIGVLYGSPETTPGGNAMKFYASLRFRTSVSKKIEHKTLKKFSGINMQVRNIKNRACRPFIVASDIKLYFEDGIDPVSGLLAPLLECERVVAKSAGNYAVAPEYLPEGKTEYKFKARVADNRIPLDVLYDCPKLIDAESREQIEAYLERWGGGLYATESDEYEEKSVSFDPDGNPIEVDSDGNVLDYEDETEETEEPEEPEEE